VADFVASEVRFAVLERSYPARAHELAALLQADVDERWRYYTQEAGVERSVPHAAAPDDDPEAVAVELGGVRTTADDEEERT
jgi:pyruvate-ferredoxin/flavodoxin oxidoreductase